MSSTPFYSLIKNSPVYKMLTGDVLDGRISHAYLLCSSDSLYISTLARMLAFFAISGEDDDIQKMNADIHILPYFEQSKKNKTIYTADVDYLIEGLYIKPSMGDKKFYIIDYGQTMNSSCQNKLLKSLEEPPKSAHIIITSTSRAALMPTVVSRCKVFEPAPFTKQQIHEQLQQLFPLSNSIDFAANAARGSLESALSMATDKKYSQMFDAALVSLLSLHNSSSVLGSGAKIMVYKDNLPLILGFYEIIFRDIIVNHCGNGELIMLKCCHSDIQTLCKMFSHGAALKIMEDIIHAQKRLKGYGNAVSVVDELLFRIAWQKAKNK